MTTAAAPRLTVRQLKTFIRDARHLIGNIRATRAQAVKVRAQVDAYIAPVFARFTFLDDEGQKITNPGALYRCDDEAKCAEFYAACDAEHLRQGYCIAPGYCPALIAESAAIDAENALLKAATKAFGAAFDTTWGDTRAKALALFMEAEKLPA